MTDLTVVADPTASNLGIAEDCRWVVESLETRRKVEPANPGGEIFRRLKSVKGRMDDWSDSRWAGEYTIEHAIGHPGDTFYDLPLLSWKLTRDSGQKWPILWLCCGFLSTPHKKGLILAFADFRKSVDSAEKLKAAQAEQGKQLADWLIPRMLTQGWTHERVRQIDAETKESLGFLADCTVLGTFIPAQDLSE
jgi:hypothetical protein